VDRADEAPLASRRADAATGEKSGGSLEQALAAPPLAAIDGGGPGEVDPAAVADTTAVGPA
jgi:hypothetical protein